MDQKKEEDIDLASYQVESGLDELFRLMQYCRHNNQDLFRQSLDRFKETEAKVSEMNVRITAMANIVGIEKAMRRRS
jgi:hypothetical protein